MKTSISFKWWKGSLFSQHFHTMLPIFSSSNQFCIPELHIYVLEKVWVFSRSHEKLQWRHNGRYNVSNHQHHHCLLNHLSRRGSKNTSKLSVTGLCAGNSPITGGFPGQMASYAENVSIRWRHHEWTRFAFYWDVLCLALRAAISANFTHSLQGYVTGTEPMILVNEWHECTKNCLYVQ